MLDGRGARTGVSALLVWAYIEVAAMSVMIVASLGMTSGIFVPLLPNDVSILGGAQLAVIAFYAVVAFRRGHIVPLLIAVFVAGYMLLSTIVFRELAGGKINFNATLSYLLILCFLPFCETRLPLGLLLRIMLTVAASYLVIYVLLNNVIIANVVNEPRLVLESDGERDRRVLLAFQWALFPLLTGMFMMRDRALPALALIGFGATAIFLSNSRMLTALAVPIVLTALIGMYAPRSRKPLAWCLAAAFLMLSLIILWGYADHNWNAYGFIARDASGTARFLEFQDAVTAIRGHELFGIGIAPTPDDLHYFIRPTRPFFAADLGTAGVFFQFGLIGAVLFMAYTVLCMVAIPADDASQTPVSRALTYATMHAGLAGFFATSLFGGSGNVFGALTIGLWLKGGYFIRREARGRSPTIDPGVTRLYAYAS